MGCETCWSSRPLIVATVALAPAIAVAAATPGAECLAVVDATQRLECFERSIGRAVADEATRAQRAARPETAVAVPESSAPRRSLLDQAWAVGADSSKSLVRLYHPNYGLFGRVTSDVNTAPYDSLFEGFAEDGDFDSVEAKFQLSFKARVWAAEERDWGVWFAYTQQNHWQVFNDDLSSPFRETNYMPELIANFRPGLGLGDWQWNQLNVGFTHQSNGRSDPISRSWNRLFVEGGVERDGFALLARAWARVEFDSDEEDDNPDITDYLGYGEVTGIWKRGDDSYTLMLRGNPATGKGAGQFTWMSRPLFGPLRAYVQIFSGYGESMIDYDWNQTTLGVGVTLNDRL